MFFGKTLIYNTLILEATHRVAVRTTAAERWIKVGRMEEQIIGVRPERSRRPIVGTATLIVDTSSRVDTVAYHR